jgi:predicted metal-dependent hydrolase
MEIFETIVGPCKLKRTRRRTLSISVLPDGTVEIVAPTGASLVAIQKKVQKRAIWIRRQRRFFSGLRVEHAERRYCTGATHRYRQPDMPPSPADS